jgi:hypothetical protein
VINSITLEKGCQARVKSVNWKMKDAQFYYLLYDFYYRTLLSIAYLRTRRARRIYFLASVLVFQVILGALDEDASVLVFLDEPSTNHEDHEEINPFLIFLSSCSSCPFVLFVLFVSSFPFNKSVR